MNLTKQDIIATNPIVAKSTSNSKANQNSPSNINEVKLPMGITKQRPLESLNEIKQ